MTDLIKSFTYGEDIGEKVAVKFLQEGVVVKAEAADDKVCGVTLFAGSEGAKGDVLMMGLGQVATSASCVAGDFLAADEDGKVKPIDFDEVQGVVFVVGRCLETATGSAVLNAVINPQAIIAPVEEAEENDTNN